MVWPWSGWPVLTLGMRHKTLCEPMASITLNLMVFKHGTSHTSNQMIWFGEWKVWHLNLTENTYTAWRSASCIKFWNVQIISINYTLWVSIIYGCYCNLLEVLYIFLRFSEELPVIQFPCWVACTVFGDPFPNTCQATGAPNENIVQNHLNIALLKVF